MVPPRPLLKSVSDEYWRGCAGHVNAPGGFRGGDRALAAGRWPLAAGRGIELEGTGRGPVGQDCGCRGQGPENGQGRRSGDRQHGQGNPAGFRGTNTPARTRRSTRTTRLPTRVRAGNKRRSSTAPPSTSSTSKARRSTPTAWNRSGACSSGPTKVFYHLYWRESSTPRIAPRTASRPARGKPAGRRLPGNRATTQRAGGRGNRGRRTGLDSRLGVIVRAATTCCRQSASP